MRSWTITSSRRIPTRTIPNPERRALDKQIRAARHRAVEIERQYGAAAADNSEQHRPHHARLQDRLRQAR